MSVNVSFIEKLGKTIALIVNSEGHKAYLRRKAKAANSEFIWASKRLQQLDERIARRLKKRKEYDAHPERKARRNEYLKRWFKTTGYQKYNEYRRFPEYRLKRSAQRRRKYAEKRASLQLRQMEHAA